MYKTNATLLFDVRTTQLHVRMEIEHPEKATTSAGYECKNTERKEKSGKE